LRLPWTLSVAVLLIAALASGCSSRKEPSPAQPPAASGSSASAPIDTAARTSAASGKVAAVRAGQKLYTCPMDTDVVSATPGTCPKCGMDLVEKK